MKITNEHYQQMHNAIADTWKNENVRASAAPMNEKTRAWYLWRVAKLQKFTCDELYKYLNDTHINTALLKIAKTVCDS